MVEISAVVDNTVLSNFALIGHEEILKAIFGDSLFTSVAVIKELVNGETRGILPKRDWGWIKVLQLESEAERRSFDLLRQRLGEGESSCLSLAISHNLKILTDDLDTRRYAQSRGIPVSGTIGILVVAVRKGVISLEEGNNYLSGMIGKGYYSSYATLNELV